LKSRHFPCGTGLAQEQRKAGACHANELAVRKGQEQGGDTMKTYIVAVLSVLVFMGLAIPGVQADPAPLTEQIGARTFSGTIEGIDPIQQIVSVQSEEKGEVRLLAFTDAEMVKGLTKGDRVVIELDERGMAKKIVKTEPAPNVTPDSKKN
jgi:hypothetical protein